MSNLSNYRSISAADNRRATVLFLYSFCILSLFFLCYCPKSERLKMLGFVRFSNLRFFEVSCFFLGFRRLVLSSCAWESRSVMYKFVFFLGSAFVRVGISHFDNLRQASRARCRLVSLFFLCYRPFFKCQF